MSRKDRESKIPGFYSSMGDERDPIVLHSLAANTSRWVGFSRPVNVSHPEFGLMFMIFLASALGMTPT